MLKRILSLMLCIVTCVTLLIPFGATAQDASLNDHLVIHYDFEGTGDEALQDKAIAGVCDEDLVFQSDKGTNNSTITDGVLHLDSANGSAVERRRRDNIEPPVLCTDIENLTDGMTVYLKMKISGTTTGAISDIMDIGNVMRLYVTGTTPALKVRFTSDAYNADTHEITIGSITKDEYFYVAITTSYNSATQQLTAKTYLSKDGLTYGTPVQKTFENVAGFYAAAATNWKGIRFGLPCHFGDRTVIGTEFDFDDVRIYNKVLSADEIISINADNPNTPTLRAVQTSAVKDNTYGIRFVSTIEKLDYTKVGFKVSYSENGTTYSDEKVLSGTTVYNSLLADGENGLSKTVSATELGGTYIFAYAITDIPITVTSIKVTMFTDGASGETTCGTYVITFADGSFVSTQKVA